MTISDNRIFFDALPDDLLLNILSRLYDDPRHLALLACVCCRFCNIIKNICWKLRCEQTLPSLVAELVSPSPPYEPPGGWASLQKLLVCCPGLWHSGVLLESWDFGLHRELAWYEDMYRPDLGVSSSDHGKGSDMSSKMGESSSQIDEHNVTVRRNCASGSNQLQGMDSQRSYHSYREDGCYNVKINTVREDGCYNVKINTVHETGAFSPCRDGDASKATELHKGASQTDAIESNTAPISYDCVPYHINAPNDGKDQSEHVSGSMDSSVAHASINSGWKRKNDRCKMGRKRRRKDLSEQCHIAASSGISREQGNKLLANRFRTDSLYICDWPGCVHLGEKRKYKIFRGIFKNFKHSHVWRNLRDMQAKATDLGCAFCVCKSTWDMVATFCLKRSIEYHDDGEPVVRAYVCENGHVAGTWTDRPMYNL